MIQAGDIPAMQRARKVRFQHCGRTYEGVVQWNEANDIPLSHQRNRQDCISLMLSEVSTMNDLLKTTPVEVLR